jgi:protein-tyrosine-phosphatase
VESAGIDTGEGLPATKEAVAVMRQMGIGISGHHSRDIANLDLARFDIVLAMTPTIAKQLRDAGVDIARIKQMNISDPYRRGIDVYRSIANDIESQLRCLFAGTSGDRFRNE